MTVTATSRDGKEMPPLRVQLDNKVTEFPLQDATTFRNDKGDVLKFTIDGGVATTVEYTIGGKTGVAKKPS